MYFCYVLHTNIHVVRVVAMEKSVITEQTCICTSTDSSSCLKFGETTLTVVCHFKQELHRYHF
jgi:hypothetical protein